MTHVTTRPDVSDKTKLKSVFENLASGFSTDGSSAIVTFDAQSRQISGLHSEVQTRDFLLTVDEPKAFGGQNLGPNPVELILAAVASCQEITYRLYAEKLGISLDGVSVTVKGDIDLRGLFAVDPGTRSGFRGLEVSVELDSTAPAAELDRLKRTVDAHCPVLDTIRNATPVIARTHRIGAGIGGRNSGTTEEIDLPLFAGLAG